MRSDGGTGGPMSRVSSHGGQYRTSIDGSLLKVASFCSRCSDGGGQMARCSAGGASCTRQRRTPQSNFPARFDRLHPSHGRQFTLAWGPHAFGSGRPQHAGMLHRTGQGRRRRLVELSSDHRRTTNKDLHHEETHMDDRTRVSTFFSTTGVSIAMRWLRVGPSFVASELIGLVLGNSCSFWPGNV
jgi:hypothetical protein